MVDVTEPDQDTRLTHAQAAPSSSRPPTPKRGLRPKLSSYLSQSGPFGNASKSEPKPVLSKDPTQEFPSWAVEDTFPTPSAEQLTDSIMCHLMSQPYDALDVSYNGSLLQIFEAYRDLSDQRKRLESRLEQEVQGRLEERSAAQQAQDKWEEEKQTYKAEVKRLELIISKGNGGVADVALARQHSLIRRRKQAATPDDGDDGKETVFEFLEKTKRFEDPSWSGQRGQSAGPVGSVKITDM